MHNGAQFDGPNLTVGRDRAWAQRGAARGVHDMHDMRLWRARARHAGASREAG